MLLVFKSFDEIDSCRLMNVYREACILNALMFYQNITDREEAVELAWEEYLVFLKDSFFKEGEDRYFVLCEDDRYISAVRAKRTDEKSCFLEALETDPSCRNKGMGKKLMDMVADYYRDLGDEYLRDEVLKSNKASLRLHEKCGFEVYENLPGERYLKFILNLKNKQTA